MNSGPLYLVAPLSLRAVGASVESFASSEPVGEERTWSIMKEVVFMGWARSSVHLVHSHSMGQNSVLGPHFTAGRLGNMVWLCTKWKGKRVVSLPISPMGPLSLYSASLRT